MKTDNRSNGGRFEQRMAQILAYNGWWAHCMVQSKAGQPADIVAVKGGYHTLIDCKVISDKRGFPFERVEDNQRLAMKLFKDLGREAGWFALQLPDDTIWIYYMSWIERAEKAGKKRLTEEEIRRSPWPLERWLMATDDWSKE